MLIFESYQGCSEESIPLICEENGQARVSGLLRFLGQDCDATSAGVTNVYAGIYGDVYNWITETINLNDTGESGDVPTSEFLPHQEAALARHNYHRCQHGVQSMTLSAALIDSAQAHADQLAAADNNLFYDQQANEGQNLWKKEDGWSGASFVDLYREAIHDWHMQADDYHWHWTPYSSQNGQAFFLTQMIWNASTELGMAHAVSATGKLFIVARYNPEGNIDGEYPDNVFSVNNGQGGCVEETVYDTSTSDPFSNHEDMYRSDNQISNCNAYQAIDLPNDLDARPIDNQGRNAYNAWIDIDKAAAVSWTHSADKCQATILDGRNVLTSAECCTPQMIIDCTPDCSDELCTDPCASDRGQMKIQITVGVESNGTTNPTLTGGCPYSSSSGDIYLNSSNHAIRDDFCIIHIDEERYSSRDEKSIHSTGSIFDIFKYSDGEHPNCFDRKAMPCIGTDLNNPDYSQNSFSQSEPSSVAYDVLQYKSQQFNHYNQVYDSSDLSTVGPQVGQECWVYNGSTQQPMKLEIVDLALCETENQHPGGELYHNDGVTFCAGLLVDYNYGVNCDFPYDDGTRGGSIICNVDNKATMMGVLVNHHITTDCSQVGLLAEFRSFSVSDTHWMKNVLEFFNNQYTVPNPDYVNAVTTVTSTTSDGSQISNLSDQFGGPLQPVPAGQIHGYITTEEFEGYQNQLSNSMPKSELEEFSQPTYQDKQEYADYWHANIGGDQLQNFGTDPSEYLRSRISSGSFCEAYSSDESSRKKRSNIGGKGDNRAFYSHTYEDTEYLYQSHLVNLGLTSTESNNLPTGWGDPAASDDPTLQVTRIERACIGVIISDTDIMTTADCCEGMKSVAVRFGMGDFIGLDYTDKTMDMGHVSGANIMRRKIFDDGTNIIINPLFKPTGQENVKEGNMCLLKTDEGMLNKNECWQYENDMNFWNQDQHQEYEPRACAKAACVSPEAPQHGDLCYVEDFTRWSLDKFASSTRGSREDPHQTFFHVNAMSDEYCKANMHWDLPSLDEMKESDQFCVGKPNFSGTLLDSDTITSHWKDGNPSGYGILCTEPVDKFKIGGQALFCYNTSSGKIEFKGLYSGNDVECEFDTPVSWELNGNYVEDSDRIYHAASPVPVKAKPGIPNIFTRLSDHYDWIQSNMAPPPPTAEEVAGLATHNEKRCWHGTQVMTLDAALTATAQAKADELAALDRPNLGPWSTGINEGESLWKKDDGWSDQSLASLYTQAVNEWHLQAADYSWYSPVYSYNGNTLDMTQIIWNASTKLGMAHAVSATGKLHIVARYLERGNIHGQFPNNIFSVNDKGPHTSACNARKKRSARNAERP